MYEIRVALDHRLIQSRLGGFLTVPEVREYARHMEATHQRWFRFRPAYRLVIDASMAKIQAQDVLAAFSDHIASYPPAEKIGVVCGASLNRFQVLRTLDRPYLRTCNTAREAQSWALDGAEADDDDFHFVASNGGLQPLRRYPSCPRADAATAAVPVYEFRFRHNDNAVQNRLLIRSE